MSKVHVMDHPLVAHKMTIIRNKHTSVKDFRELVSEIGMLINKKAVHLALDTLLCGIKTVQTDLPAQGVVTLMEQKEQRRYVCHLLYASPVKRGTDVEVIEDIIPLYNVSLTLRTKRTIKRAYLAPAGEELPYAAADGAITLTVPKIDCHQMVVLDY